MTAESGADGGVRARRVGEQLFEEKIAPIFAERCLSCHNDAKAHGLLRLDSRDGALRGGESHRRVAEVDPANNYLWQRVTSSDGEERMPAEGEPLTEPQLAELRQWVQLSAPWPDPSAATETARRGSGLPLWVRGVLATIDPVDRAMRYHAYFPVIYLFAALLCPIALAGRLRRQRHAQADRWRSRRWKLWVMRGVNGYYYLASVFALVVLGMGLHIQVIDRTSQKYGSELAALRGSLLPSKDGDKPAAYYPKHPDRIGGTYYRGNDERSDKLYNGGVYRTCTFRLELRGSDGRRCRPATAFRPDRCR